jgi:hypothetical protein
VASGLRDEPPDANERADLQVRRTAIALKAALAAEARKSNTDR